MDESSDILAMQKNIPKYISTNKVSPVYSSLNQFFTQVPNYEKPKLFSIFKNKGNNVELVVKEKLFLASLGEKKDIEGIIHFFTQKPEAISEGVKLLTAKNLIEMYKSKYYNDYLMFTIESNDVELLKFTLFDMKEKKSIFSNKNINSAIEYLKNSGYLTPLSFDYVTSSHFGIEHKLPYDFIGSATSLASSESSVFIGSNSNHIIVFQSPGCSHHFQPYNISLEEIKIQQPFSICNIDTNLFIFTQYQVYSYNIENKKFTLIVNKRKENHPVCTDGRNFYSVDIYNSKVTFFGIDSHNKVVSEKSIKLQINSQTMKIIDKEWNIPMATNGTFLSILVRNDNQQMFYIFSLITGDLLYTEPILAIPKIDAFTIAPYSGRTVVFNAKDLTIFPSPHNIPKYQFNTIFPHSPDSKSFSDHLYIALYQGRQMFYNGDPKFALEIFNKYLKDNNEKGINIALQLLMHQDLALNAEANATLLEFAKKASPEMQRAALSTFFMWIRNNSNPDKKVQLPNVCNYLFEQKLNLDMVFCFFDCINFRTFKLSLTAVSNMILYLLMNIDKFPLQCESIIKPFLIKYFPKHFSRDFKEMFLICDTLINIIRMSITKVSTKQMPPEIFFKTVQFRLWKVLIYELYQIKEKLIEHAEEFILPLNFLTTEPLEETQNSFPTIQMVANTLFLFCYLLFNLPHRKYESLFTTIEDFYKEFDHPLSRKYPEVDERLFLALNGAYDIDDKETFFKLFCNLRRYLVFENPSGKQRLKYKFENLSYTSSSVEHFFKTGTPKFMYPLLQENCIKKMIETSTEREVKYFPWEFEVIFFGHLPNILSRAQDFIQDVNRSKLAKFIQMFRYPYAFPAEILSAAKISVDAAGVHTLPLETMIDRNLQLKGLPPIHDPADAIKLLKEIDYSNLEVSLFRAALLWLYGIQMKGQNIFEDISDVFINSVMIGSCRTIEILMAGLQYDNCSSEESKTVFRYLLKILTAYCYGQIVLKNIHEATEISNAILCITDALRKHVARKDSYFLKLLTEFINEDDKNFTTSCMIFQNCIDVIRLNAKAKVVFSTGETVSGTIVELVEGNFVLQNENEDIKVKESEVDHIWCYPNTEIHPDNFNLQFFADKFISLKPGSEVAEMMFCASFLFFSQSPKFRCLIPISNAEKFFAKDFSNFARKSVVLQFINSIPGYYSSSLPDFAFSAINDDASLPRGMKNGVISTMFLSETFTSCPIYPFAASRITMTIRGNESVQAALSLRVASYGSSTDSRFEMNQIDVEMAKFDERQVVVEIRPSISSVVVTVDGVDEHKSFFSPSTEFIYLIARVGRLVLIDYKFEELPQEKFLEKDEFNFKNSVLKIAQNDFNIPCIESAIYNKYLFADRKNLVINSMKQLISALFNVPMNANQFFGVMRNFNCFPFEESIDIEGVMQTNLWMDGASIFSKYAKSFKCEDNEIYKHVKKRLKQFRMLDSNNRSCILIPPNNPIYLSNCYVFSKESAVPLKMIGVEKMGILSSHLSMAVPYNNIDGTIFDVVLMIRHSLRFFNYEEIMKIKKAMKKLVANRNYYDSIFGKLIKFIESTFCKVPENDEIVSFNKECFLTKSKTFTDNIEKFIKLFYLFSGKESKFDGKSASVNERGDIIIGIKTDEEPGKFIIIDQDVKTEIISGNYIIMHNVSNPAVKTTSSLYDLTKYTVLYNKIPDISMLIKEIPQWTIRHSQQLLQIFPEVFDQNVFQNIPLSSRFSAETCQFMYSLLKSLSSSNLQIISSHITSRIETARDDKETKILPSRDKYNSPSRIAFLKATKQTLLSTNDYRTQLLNHIGPQNFGIRRNLDSIIIMVDGSREQQAWMKRYVEGMKEYTFIVFVEFTTGSFDISQLQKTKLCIRFVSNENLIENFPNDLLLNVGKFKTESDFHKSFNSVLQKYDESV